jgi:hypothetical protein
MAILLNHLDLPVYKMEEITTQLINQLNTHLQQVSYYLLQTMFFSPSSAVITLATPQHAFHYISKSQSNALLPHLKE